jgi:hypothetical protein
MSTDTNNVDVLTVMDDAVLGMARHPTLQVRMRDLETARDAVAELIAASNRTIRAFEAYGRASGLVAEARGRMECEGAMAAQKESIARIGGDV